MRPLTSNPEKFGPSNVETRSLTNPSSWLDWVGPSFTDLLFVVLLWSFTVGGLATRLLRDAGIGWHIRNGQQMLASHAITRIDSFSTTMSGHPWYAWEWLYDGAIAVVHDRAGLNGVELFTALVISFTFALLARATLARGANLVVTVPLVLLAISASMIHCLARPHVLSWLLGLVWFVLLDRAATTGDSVDRRRLFWLPVLMLSWVNLHGGFLVGFVLIACYLADSAFQVWRNRRFGVPKHQEALAKTLVGMAGLSALATFLNPYGFLLHEHIYGYLTDPFLMNHIDEFRSPDFHGIAQQCFAALLLVAAGALALSRQKMRLAHVLVVLFAVWSGLYASRSLPVASILLTLIAAPLLSAAMVDASESARVPDRVRRTFSQLLGLASRITAMERSFRGHALPVLAVIASLWVVMHGGVFGSRRIMDARFDGKRFPVQALEGIEGRNIREPIFTPDFWGGYLIYRHHLVFVDDRHDLYGAEFFKQYLATVRVAPDWERMLNDLHVRWVLVPAGSALGNILREAAPWRVEYEDQTAVLFRKSRE